MPRQLPWKTAAATNTTTTTAKTSSSPLDSIRSSSGKKASSVARVARGEDGDSSPRAQVERGRSSHSASTSPPPAPPSDEGEDLMRPGLVADDAYVMVEDEFLVTARSFTAHLHYAEYQRLKAVARARKQHEWAHLGSAKSVTTSDNDRSSRLNRNRDTMAPTRAASDGVPSPYDDSDDDIPALAKRRTSPPSTDDAWLGTSLGLLLSPHKRRHDPLILAGLEDAQTHMRSNTRAARGYGASHAPVKPAKPPALPRVLPPEDEPDSNAEVAHASFDLVEDEDTEDESDDDLDRPSTSRAPRRTEQPLTREAVHSLVTAKRPTGVPPIDNAGASASVSKQRAARPWLVAGSTGETGITDVDTNTDTRAGVGMDKEASTGKGKRRTLDVNEIPTFLI